MSHISASAHSRKRRRRIAGIVAAAACIPLMLSGTASAAASNASAPTVSGISAPAAPSALTGQATSASACPPNAFCLFNSTSFGGSWWGWQAPSARIQLSAYGFNDVDRSWVNNRTGGVRVYNDWKNGNVAGIYFDAHPHRAEGTISPNYNHRGSGVALYP
jgi:hypothetical protein